MGADRVLRFELDWRSIDLTHAMILVVVFCLFLFLFFSPINEGKDSFEAGDFELVA